MTEQNQTPEVNVEMAKQLGKAALKSGINAITGKSETSVLNYLVIGLRSFGVALFLCAIFQVWFFELLAVGIRVATESSAFVTWLKVSGIGLLMGILVYGTAEVISLLQKMERYLHKISDKS